MLSTASSVLVFLLCQLPGPAASGAPQELVGAVGGSVTFPLAHSVNRIDSIVWFFKSTTLVTIQPNTTNKQDIVIVTQHYNKRRVDFSHGNYSLKLSKLHKNDSGVYSAHIYSPSLQEPFTQEYGLHVYDYLPKPQITLGLKNNKNGTCVTNLTCSMEWEGEDVAYSWKSLGHTSNESHNGPILPVTWRLGEKDMTFICMVRNPISSNSSNPVFALKLCKGVAGALDSTRVWNLLWIFLPFIVLVLVLITIWRQRGKEFIKEKKKMDTHQEILNNSLPSGETSEYDTISNLNKMIPEEKALNTIYSTLQIPPEDGETPLTAHNAGHSTAICLLVSPKPQCALPPVSSQRTQPNEFTDMTRKLDEEQRTLTSFQENYPFDTIVIR